MYSQTEMWNLGTYDNEVTVGVFFLLIFISLIMIIQCSNNTIFHFMIRLYSIPFFIRVFPDSCLIIILYMCIIPLKPSFYCFNHIWFYKNVNFFYLSLLLHNFWVSFEKNCIRASMPSFSQVFTDNFCLPYI